jgi:hypothetical protein
MVMELGRFISDQLKTLPKDHEDREFLSQEYLRVREKELRDEIISAGFNSAKLKQTLNGFVDLAKHKHKPISGDERKQNADIKRVEAEKFKEESITNLLPDNSVLFNMVINPLLREGINTAQDLRECNPDEVKRALGIRENYYGNNFGNKTDTNLISNVAFAIWKLSIAKDEEKKAIEREASKKLRLAQEAPREQLSVEEAKRRLNELVFLANERHSRFTLDMMESNEILREEMTKKNGDRSVVELLPSNFALFAHIMNPLMRGNINTKQELIRTPREDLKQLRDVGPVKMEILDAMRDLAMAESKVQTSGKPQA